MERPYHSSDADTVVKCILTDIILWLHLCDNQLPYLLSMQWICRGETVCQGTDTHVAPSITWGEKQRHLQDLDPV